MATIDIRNDVVQDIDKIVFSEDCNDCGDTIANALKRFNEFVEITDDSGAYVWVDSIAHANNLIKALNKAIALGWLK